MQAIKPGIYRHYKGFDYEVIDMAIHSETLEELVLYRPLYGDSKLWVRPASMFLERLLVEGRTVTRFEYIGEAKSED